jgi:hypothetical protein
MMNLSELVLIPIFAVSTGATAGVLLVSAFILMRPYSESSFEKSLNKLSIYLEIIFITVLIASFGLVNGLFPPESIWAFSEVVRIYAVIGSASLVIGVMITLLFYRSGILGIITISKARMLDIAPELIKPSGDDSTLRGSDRRSRAG